MYGAKQINNALDALFWSSSNIASDFCISDLQLADGHLMIILDFNIFLSNMLMKSMTKESFTLTECYEIFLIKLEARL